MENPDLRRIDASEWKWKRRKMAPLGERRETSGPAHAESHARDSIHHSTRPEAVGRRSQERWGRGRQRMLPRDEQATRRRGRPGDHAELRRVSRSRVEYSHVAGTLGERL